MVSQLIDFLKSSYTAYQAVENAKAYLSEKTEARLENLGELIRLYEGE